MILKITKWREFSYNIQFPSFPYHLLSLCSNHIIAMAFSMRRALRLRTVLQRAQAKTQQMRFVGSQSSRSSAAAALDSSAGNVPPSSLSDDEVVDMVLRRELPMHTLEKVRRRRRTR